jgi:glycosyltransferase involved in cell wall biosynthesis
MGHEVLVVCPESQSMSLPKEHDFYAIRRYPTYVSLRDLGRRRPKEGAVPFVAPKTSLGRPTTHAGPRPRGLLAKVTEKFVRLIAYPAYLTWALWKAGREFNAHVYVTNDLDTLLAGVLCSMTSRALVHDAHELWPDQFIGMGVYSSTALAWLRMLERILLRRANVVITVNEFIGEELEKRYKIRKPQVILNVPALEHYHLVHRPVRRATAKKVALYQGLFTFHRGLENLVNACQFLEDDVTLVLRGYGPNENQLREIAKQYTNCRFEKPVHMNELVSAAANTGHIGIVPYAPVNINNYLASPNKLFEYIQAGLPVVGSDLPFLRKIILGHEVGYVFDPNSPSDIARAINTATRDSVLPILRTNVRRIQKRYCWDEEQEKLVSLVRRLTHSPKSEGTATHPEAHTVSNRHQVKSRLSVNTSKRCYARYNRLRGRIDESARCSKAVTSTCHPSIIRLICPGVRESQKRVKAFPSSKTPDRSC